ncbi:DUF2793 domain-containing protein [Rhodovulum sp. P5]|uniref:DUF2793 domain-containing protein n=1 Tax=Rhodovulum sp. P5 TaxID=1564506 RepID=UPI0009DA70B7|nr:DUF2793 domain-containing protein [Rhodovulum sp. P5]
MTETANLEIPLLEAAQAQKHVTVNEALIRLDALVQLRLQSLSLSIPPLEASEGHAWAIAENATAAWEGKDGKLALWDNGGWVFVEPRVGWCAWVLDINGEVRFDGVRWNEVAAASGPVSGAALRFRVLEFDQPIAAGGRQSTSQVVPAHSMVFGVTVRVISEITGTLTSWSLGAAGCDDRFGSDLGLSLNSHARGVLGTPLTEYTDMPIDLSPEGGEFSGGIIRFAVHYAELTLPSAV